MKDEDNSLDFYDDKDVHKRIYNEENPKIFVKEKFSLFRFMKNLYSDCTNWLRSSKVELKEMSIEKDDDHKSSNQLLGSNKFSILRNWFHVSKSKKADAEVENNSKHEI